MQAGSGMKMGNTLTNSVRARLRRNAWTASRDSRSIKLLRGGLFLLICLFIFSFFLVCSGRSFDTEEDILQPTGLQELNGGQIVEQDLAMHAGDYLDGISIQYETYDRTNRAMLTVTLLQDNVPIQSWVKAASNMREQEYYRFYLGHAIRIRKDCTITVRIQESGAQPDEYISPYICDISQLTDNADTDDLSKFAPMRLNGQPQEGQFLCCAPLLKNISLARRALCSAWILFAAILLLQFLQIREEYLMIFLFVVNILLWSATVPVGQLPDEPNHFLRIFEITCGNLLTPRTIDGITSGDILPLGLENLFDPNALVDWSKTRIYTFPNTALYSPFSYIPQAIAVKAARYLTADVHTLYYCARLGSCLLCTLLCIYALWIIPYGKKILFTILMFPITIEGLITLSPDGMTLAICFLLMAVTLRAEHNRQPLRRREVVLLSVLCLLLSQYKMVYVPIILLVLIIPRECYSSGLQRVYVRIVLPVLAILLYIVWFHFASLYTMNVGYIPGTDSGTQIHYMLSHMPETYKIFVRTITQETNSLVGQTFGSSLEWDLHNYELVPISLLVLLTYEICTDHELPLLRRRTNALMLLTVILVLGMTMAGIYAQGSPLGAETVVGLQGRYFLEILPLSCYILITLLNRSRAAHGALIRYESRSHYLYLILMNACGLSLLDIISSSL